MRANRSLAELLLWGPQGLVSSIVEECGEKAVRDQEAAILRSKQMSAIHKPPICLSLLQPLKGSRATANGVKL